MPLVPVVSDFQDQNYKSNLSRHLHASVYTREQPQQTLLLLGGMQDYVYLCGEERGQRQQDKVPRAVQS